MANLSTPWTWRKPLAPASLIVDGIASPALDRTWARSLWAWEKVCALGDLSIRGTWDIALSSELCVQQAPLHVLNIALIKSAIRSLRFRHPAIAVRYGWTEKPKDPSAVLFTYQTPESEAEVDDWLDEAVVDHSEALAAANGFIETAIASVRYSLQGADFPPLSTAFRLHFIPPNADGKFGVLLHLKHAAFDGYAAFQVLNEVISHIAKQLGNPSREPIAWGEEAARLARAVPLRSKVPWPQDKTPEDEEIVARFNEARTVAPGMIGIPVGYPDRKSTKTGSVTDHVPANIISAALSAAQKHDCPGIFPILQAASILTILQINGEKEKATSALLCVPCDLRKRHLNVGVSDKSKWEMSYAVTNAFFAARDLDRFKYKSEEEKDEEKEVEKVWTLAKELKDEITVHQSHFDRVAVWIDDLMAAAVAPTTAKPSVEEAPKAITGLSSLGNVDQFLDKTFPIESGGEITVENPILNATLYEGTMGVGLMIHTFIWQGKLGITFSFPEGSLGTVDEQLGAHDDGEMEKAAMKRYVDIFMDIPYMIAAAEM